MFNIFEDLWYGKYEALCTDKLDNKNPRLRYGYDTAEKALKEKLKDDAELAEMLSDYSESLKDYYGIKEYEAFKMGMKLSSLMYSEMINDKIYTMDNEEIKLINEFFYKT